MTIYTPYVYLIGWSGLDRYYIGSEYAEKTKIANPSNLWNSYFTSSACVEEFRNEHGEPDIIQVRKTFVDRSSTRSYESKMIRRMRAVQDDRFLNKSDGNKQFDNPSHTEERKKEISDFFRGRKQSPDHVRKRIDAAKPKMQGRIPWNKGIPQTPEQKRKNSKSHLGKKLGPQSEEHKRKISEARKKAWLRKKASAMNSPNDLTGTSSLRTTSESPSGQPECGGWLGSTPPRSSEYTVGLVAACELPLVFGCPSSSYTPCKP